VIELYIQKGILCVKTALYYFDQMQVPLSSASVPWQLLGLILACGSNVDLILLCSIL